MQKVITQGAVAEPCVRASAALPLYSKGEEIFNAVSHIVGAALGGIILIFTLLLVLPDPAPNRVAGVLIYSLSVIVLYTMSALYHFLPQGRAKRVFRIFDHCTIFLLIAGCYTPFCLIPLWEYSLGRVIFTVEWSIAILGIAFNSINMHWKAVKVLSQIGYVIMGWMVVFAVPALVSETSLSCFLWLLSGGIAYTVGIVFYALGKKKPVLHCVWHVFVLLGTALQFVSVWMIL